MALNGKRKGIQTMASGKISKRKQDLIEQSDQLARQIGERIRTLQKKIKDNDGRPINALAFFNIIFSEPEYQKGTDDPSEPKSDNSKQVEISAIENGKDINLALLCRISDKCGVSLDYLIRGKEYQPSESTCPPEEKDASPAGAPMESQTENAPSSSGNDPIEFQGQTEETPISAQDSKDGILSLIDIPQYDKFLEISLEDICKALAAMAFITDMTIHKENIQACGRIEPGICISIFPKEEIYPVFEKLDKEWGLYKWEVTEESSEPKEKIQAFHLFDKRGRQCIDFLRRILQLKNTLGVFGCDNGYENGIEWEDVVKSIDTILSATLYNNPESPLLYVLGYGVTAYDFLNAGDDDIFDDNFRIYTEPYQTFLERENKQAQ